MGVLRTLVILALAGAGLGLTACAEAPRGPPLAEATIRHPPLEEEQARARPRPKPVPARELPREVTVQPGETLNDIGERLRTPVQAIADMNGLTQPYRVAPGTKLLIPPPLFYEVQAGDTYEGVGRRFGIDPRSIANLNDLEFEQGLRTGQKLALPPLVRDLGASADASGPTPLGARIGTAPLPSRPAGAHMRRPSRTAADAAAAVAAAASRKPSAPTTTPADPPPAAATASPDLLAAGKGRFEWPVKGEVVSGYGPKGAGLRNDGVNIAAAEGTPVHAAAAGEVVYAGSSVPGFGNLVLIRHAGGWVTAYGHLAKINVKMQAIVSRESVIGQVGRTGNVETPQLHFEIRHAASTAEKPKPVDPSQFLP